MIKKILGMLLLFSGFCLMSFVKYQDTMIEQTNETQIEESSKQNDVDSNIEVISSDCFPGDACSFVLASHSGTSSIAFFKHLNELQLEDVATIYYNNAFYDYVLKNIQHVKKNGTISLVQPKESELVLTTCNKTDNSLQDIYIFELRKEA